jgi:hypothetical protein
LGLAVSVRVVAAPGVKITDAVGAAAPQAAVMTSVCALDEVSCTVATPALLVVRTVLGKNVFEPPAPENVTDALGTGLCCAS